MSTDKELLAQTLDRLKKLEEVVQQLQQKLEQGENNQTSQKEKARSESEKLNPDTIFEIDLMNLPDSLRRTMMVMTKLGYATPEEVAEETKRTRGLENIYLNQLERLNYIEKFKKGKRVYFRSLRVAK